VYLNRGHWVQTGSAIWYHYYLSEWKMSCFNHISTIKKTPSDIILIIHKLVLVQVQAPSAKRGHSMASRLLQCQRSVIGQPCKQRQFPGPRSLRYTYSWSLASDRRPSWEPVTVVTLGECQCCPVADARLLSLACVGPQAETAVGLRSILITWARRLG